VLSLGYRTVKLLVVKGYRIIYGDAKICTIYTCNFYSFGCGFFAWDFFKLRDIFTFTLHYLFRNFILR